MSEGCAIALKEDAPFDVELPAGMRCGRSGGVRGRIRSEVAMAEAALRRYSFHEYIAEEEASEEKHAFFDGQILAMAGGSMRHSRLGLRAGSLLDRQLENSTCRTYNSELRVRVLATGLATYPDLSVICGPPVRDPANRPTAVNPILLVEVLSPRTERYDRDEKFDHYQQLPTLKEYVLISTRQEKVEVFHRNEDGSWRYTRSGPGEIAHLGAIGATLVLEELYRDLPDDEPEEITGGDRRRRRSRGIAQPACS